jgi:WD40 repeat protein
VSGFARLGRAGVLLAVVASAACVSGPSTPAVVSPSVSAVPTSTASPEPTGSIAAPSPSVIASPQATPDRSAPVVRANALGRLTGNWIFVGKQVPYAYHISAEVQIWAIPLDGGAPRLAFAYDVSTGGAPEAIFDNFPYLRRQFSPDGTRMVVSAGGQLVVVDLPTGRVTPLGTQGYFPSWSKDGSRIAFVFYLPVDQVVPPEEAIGVIPATGGPVTQLAKVGYSRQSVEWSPNGSLIMVAEPGRTTIIDAANGSVIRVIPGTASLGSSFAHWRSAASQIVLAAGNCDQTTMKLITLGDASEPYVTQLDTGKRCPELSIKDPRWNPARATELLYVATRAEQGRMPSEYRAHVLDTFSGRDFALPFDVYEATWTWDGERIAYVTANEQRGFGDSVALADRDGTGSRTLMGATGEDFFFSVASLSY